MKLRSFCLLLLGLTLADLTVTTVPAMAQIREVSNRKLRRETRKAARQAHRAARRAGREDPSLQPYLDMSVYNMKPGESGRKTVKTTDGRANYQFNKNGEAMVTDAPELTPKRLKRKK
jgi:hypothetical protein